MEQKIDLEISPETARGNYSNLAVITHSASEFILDFAENVPGLPKTVVGCRVIMTPDHAKRLLAALNENIAKYERQFGEIRLNDATFVIPGGGANA